MRTIVQEYGPIYGEPVNGTVMGRPNGSVYVPTSNTISLTIDEDYRYLIYKFGDTQFMVCNSSGQTTDGSGPGVHLAVAVAQDLSSYIVHQFYSDSELTTLVGYRILDAGSFNNRSRYPANAGVVAGLEGETLYARAQLMNNGVAIATSNVIEVEVYSP